MKKTVLIAPVIDFTESSLVSRFTPLFSPPLGVLALGSFLQEHAVPVELIDVQIDFGLGLSEASDRLVAQQVATALAGQSDEIAWIGISFIYNSKGADRLIHEISAAVPEIPLVLGGYFPTNSCEELLRANEAITAIVLGDGEEAALAISHRLERALPLCSPDVPNLAWLEDDELRTSPPHPVNVKELPVLDFGLLENPSSYQIIALMTSRGCPFKCNYCLECTMRPYGDYPTEWFRQQLEQLARLEISDRILIYDPIFGLGPKRTLELVEIMERHDFRYATESRGDVIKPSQLASLKAAGMDLIYLGIESASPDTLLRMNKVRSLAEGEKYVRKTLDVLEACFDNDITPVLGLMFCFPGDREADYRHTLELVRSANELQAKSAAKTGRSTGFIPLTLFTGIYDGSALATNLKRDFPDVVLDDQAVIGSRTVLSSSPEVGEKLTRRYQALVAKQGSYTPIALERLWLYSVFSTSTYVGTHPELIDDAGVVHWGTSFQRYSSEFDIAAAFMHYGHFFSGEADSDE